MIAKGKYILTGFCWQKCLFPGVGYHFSVSFERILNTLLHTIVFTNRFNGRLLERCQVRISH